MKYLILLTIILLGPISVQAQMFYTTNFGSGGGGLPSGWTSSDSRISTNTTDASSGYFTSSTSPQASGGNNVIFQNCTPTNSTITLDCAGVINTTGLTQIRVGMGVKRTSAWGPSMSLAYSINGSTYTNLSTDISTSAPVGNWGTIFIDLPTNANNQPNLRFRFTYVSNSNSSCNSGSHNFTIDDFSVGSNKSLPIDLVNFTTRLIGKTVQLNWATESELNNSHFIIEHSNDGYDYSEITSIQGHGNSQKEIKYSFLDRNPFSGENYYRLKQVDFDGSSAYSPVKSINLSLRGGFSIAPTVSKENITITFNEIENSEAQYEIISIGSGSVIGSFRKVEGQTNTIVPVNTFPNGSYVIRVKNEANYFQQIFFKTE